MKKTTIFTIGLLLFAVLLCSAASAKSSAVLLQEALYAEEVEGNLNSAIKIYEQIIADESAQRPHKAQALFRLGNCYLKLKDEQQAKAAFEKLVTGFSDQAEIVAKARPILEELSNADPAVLMPPETLAYIEFGSPGRQIETILNMLKGTQFENPLAAVGAGMSNTGRPAGEKSPQDIFAALLNPSMMAEFKKIRGMGFGITGFTGEGGGHSAEGIAVFFPGKSDALRGIIIAALGMTGRSVEPIEGMQTLALGDMAYAAYDDTIVIISISKKDSAGQLARTIKQYKGVTTNPTLASSNKSFAKISKKDRQQNMFTMWANVDQLYAEIAKQFPDGKLPDEMLIAQGFVDFADIDDVVSFVSLEEQNITFQTDVAFKDGHHCLVYDLIRTPNLNRTAFGTVPSEAIALVSFALSPAESAQAKTASQKIQNITGLDIGREIFANIEQVTLFVVPPAKAGTGAKGLPPIANCIGLSLTSHDPQKTMQIFTTLLSTANLVTGNPQTAQSETSTGKYQVGLVNDQKLYCYVNQVSKATILSLNPDIVESSINAGKTGKSVYQGGPLKDVISKLPPTTSKLVLVNAGGAILVAAGHVNIPSSDPNQNVQQIFAQLARACDKTVIQLRTDEEPNSFSVRASISGLPPANQIIGPVTQLSQAIGRTKAQVWAEQTKVAAPAASIVKANRPPAIDGQAEDLWSSARKYDIKNVMYTAPSGPNNCSASYKTLWDANNLYLFVEVADDKLIHDSEDFWNDDSIEVFIDSDNSKSESYGDNDFQFHFDWDKAKPAMGERNGKATQGVEFAMVTTGNGYRTEIKFPWSTLKAKPSAGTTIGFDIHIDDDDDGGDRDSKLAWFGKDDNAWENPQALGNAQLSGLVGWWKFDESEGTTAADSSGNGNNGVIQVGPKWQPSGGKFGGALKFDGDGDYVKIVNERPFDTTSQITVAAWVNIASINTEWTAIVTKGDSAWRLSTESNNPICHFAINSSTRVSGQRRVEPGQWHHVAGVYDGKQMRIYIDGTLDASEPSDSGIATNDQPVYIGENSEQPGRFWHGLIDDVRVYNYAISESDIAGLVAGK